jgi:hypothetical protein
MKRSRARATIGRSLSFHGDNSVFSNTSLHSRITNAFSDIGRPRRCTLARLGASDLRAQTQIPSVLRSDTPTHFAACAGKRLSARLDSCDASAMFKEVPVSALFLHVGHIPHPTLDDAASEQLLQSVQELGLLQPLLVSEEGAGRFLIIDGARRFLCARELRMEKVWCMVHSKNLAPGDHELIRLQEGAHRPSEKEENGDR